MHLLKIFSKLNVTLELFIYNYHGLLCNRNVHFCNSLPLEQPLHIYISVAPIKALCSERFEDWKQKFGGLGLQCRELTGDTEIDDYYELQDAHIIFTTPVRI